MCSIVHYTQDTYNYALIAAQRPLFVYEHLSLPADREITIVTVAIAVVMVHHIDYTYKSLVTWRHLFDVCER